MSQVKMNTGILLAAFGSSNPMAHLTLSRFDAKVRDAFPGVPVRWAFTSGVIRRRLANKGKKTDSVLKALEKMRFERFERVAVQSLHVIPGREFNDLAAVCRDMGETAVPKTQGVLGKGFKKVLLGAPLLSGARDVRRAAEAIVRHIPEERAPGEAVVLMGHGTWHEGDAMYQKLSDAVRPHDADVHIGTMDGAGSVTDIANKLASQGVRRAWLMPLLAVVGAHALHDMAGEHPESWKSILEARGIACTPVMTSAAEYDGFAAIWVDHLREVMGRLTD